MSKFQEVIDTAVEEAKLHGIYEEGDENLIALEANCFMHSTADAGRPSDAARSTARAYFRDPVKFRADFKANRA